MERILHADIKLNYICNNCCIHCNVSDIKERIEKGGMGYQPSTTEVLRKLSESRKEGAEAVTLTGGEPTLRSDFVKIVNHAAGIGFFIGIQTNARLLSYRKYAEIFTRYPVHFVVSVNGSCSEIHDSITGVEGSFSQTLRGIGNLISLGFSPSINCVISKKNARDLTKTAALFHDMGIKRINFVFPQIMGNALLFFDEVVPKFADLREELQLLISFADKCRSSLSLRFHNMPFCITGGRADLSADSELKNVESWLKNLNLEERNWNEDKSSELKVKFEKCHACLYNGTCEGIWREYATRFGEEEFKPFCA